MTPNNHIAFAVEEVDGTCEMLMTQELIMEIPPKDYYWGVLRIYAILMDIKWRSQEKGDKF